MVLASQLVRWAADSKPADALLRERARTVFNQSGLFRTLPLTGLMLEVGAANAHLVEAVMRRTPYRRCVAIDPLHRPAPRLARRLRRRDFAALRANGAALPFRDDRFDAAWASFALHGLQPAVQEQVLREMSRVVRPGGTLVLIEDTPAAAWHRAAARWEDLRLRPMAPASYHYRSRPEWRAALPGCGWRVLEEVPFTSVFLSLGAWLLPRTSFVCTPLGV